ncbi:MAG TPA: sensor histidine kinase [Burkholderiaceae bacterium]|nr:sensor histidine kinase [Burkholderiaceae bacterium]
MTRDAAAGAHRRCARRIASIALAALLWIVALAPRAVGHEPGPSADPWRRDGLVVDRVSWTFSSSPIPPDADADWREATLPLRWRKPDDVPLVQIWFRLRFAVSESGQAPLALYVPKLGNGGTVWLNGRRVGEVRTMDERTQVRWFRPFLFPIRDDLLRVGDNEIVVRQVTRDARNVLRPMVVGPLDALVERHERTRFWQHTTATIAVWFCVPMGLFLIALWWRRREEGLHAIFGVACLLWALRSASFVVEVVPVALWFPWRLLYYVGTGGFIAAMTIGLAWFADHRPRLLPRIALAYWAVGPLTFLVVGWPAQFLLDQVWLLGFLPMTGWAVAVLARAWWRSRSPSRAVLLLAIAAAIAIALHDYLLGLDPRLLPWGNIFGLHLAAPLVLAALGTHLLDRFVRSAQAAESLAQLLEQRVAARERELADNFARLRVLERERAHNEERERIMRELHDGVGSQLLSSLVTVERGAADREDVARMLRECLDDMRLALDTLTPGSADLGGALGNLRWRLAPRLEAAGIANRWRLQSLPDELPVSPHHALQLLRIVQEALANVIKHAGATRVEVGAALRGDVLEIEVVDDGAGFDAARPTGGRGLRNMRRRAHEAGATLSVEPVPGGGTRVRVLHPVSPPVDHQGEAPYASR